MARINRREFIQAGAIAALGAGLGAAAPADQKPAAGAAAAPDPKQARNYNADMPYRRLPNTDLYFSAISLGGIGLEQRPAHYAIDHGVNLVHTCIQYKNGQSIKELGEVLKTKRDKVYIALKNAFYKGSLDDINQPLKIMGVEYVDFIMFNRHEPTAAADPKIAEMFAKWKEQGKVRYAGLTTHDMMKECVDAGVKSGMYSIIQPVLNQPSLESMLEELKAAQAKGVGIMAMKSVKGVNDPAMQVAYVKKLLANPAVTTVNKAFPNFELFDAFLKAAREPLTAQEDRGLYRYAQANRSENCMLCGECTGVCPMGIDIPTTMRAKYYYLDQLHDVETARAAYREIPVAQRFMPNCTECEQCEGVCPNRISIIQKMKDASRALDSIATV